jgi:hypothetical protein
MKKTVSTAAVTRPPVDKMLRAEVRKARDR